MVLLALLLLAQAPSGTDSPTTAAAPAPLTLAEAVRLARQSSPLAEAARAQAEGAVRAARVAGRLADPTFDLRVENWRPGTSSFVAGSETDTFVVATHKGTFHGVMRAHTPMGCRWT